MSLRRTAISLLFFLLACCSDEGPEPPSSAAPAPQLTAAALALPRGQIVLTFDDGPDVSTLPLAKYLHGEGIQAVFFINGARTCRPQGDRCVPAPSIESCQGPGTRQPESVLAAVVRLGHRLGNHTQSHCSLERRPELADEELAATHAIITRHQPDPPYLFRAPYGAWTMRAEEVARPVICRSHLVGPVFWDTRGADWMCARDGITPDRCAQLYLDAIDESPQRGGVVVLHDRNEFAPGTDYTLRLVQALVPALKRRGQTFAPPGVLYPHGESYACRSEGAFRTLR